MVITRHFFLSKKSCHFLDLNNFTCQNTAKDEKPYIVKWICGGVDPLVQGSVDAESKVVVDVVGKSFPLQDEFDDSGANRLREKVASVGVESVKY